MIKTIFSFALISSVSISAFATTTEAVEQRCGKSDQVYDYILKTTNTKSKSNFPMSAAIGSGRRLIIYPDNSWLLTLEFLSHKSTDQDRTCIIAKGNIETQSFATDILKYVPNPEEENTPAPAPAPARPVRPDVLRTI